MMSGVLNEGNDEELRDEYTKFREGVGTQTDLTKEDLESKEEGLARTQQDYQKLQKDYKTLEDNLTKSQETNQRNEERIDELEAEVAQKEKTMISTLKQKGAEAEVELLETMSKERDQ